MSKKQQSGLLKSVNSLKPGDSSQALYDEWSANYDQDLATQWGYRAPDLAVQALASRYPQRGVPLVDLGCGTGLVGEALARAGFTAFDGIDVSAGMLSEARDKGIYRELFQEDLTGPIPVADGQYGAAICVGSMGAGHIGAQHVPEMLRIVQPGAHLIIYMNAQRYQHEGFEQAFFGLQNAQVWCIEQIESSNYMSALDWPGRLIAARKPASN